MPVGKRTNNRILPSNARSPKVASDAINAVLPMQNAAYDNAFQVQGYAGCLYHRLSSGLACLCKKPMSGILPKLDSNGMANPETIDSLITGGLEFGVTSYGSSRKQDVFYRDTPKDIERKGYTGGDPHISGNTFKITDDDDNFRKHYIPDGISDIFGDDSGNTKFSTIVPDGVSSAGPVTSEALNQLSRSLFDDNNFSLSDVSCPVCFGTGWVSGFSLYNGWRRSLVPFDTDSVKNSSGYLDTTAFAFPVLKESTYIEWSVTLPNLAIGVDSLRVFSGSDIVQQVSIYVDTVKLVHENQIIQYCDGLPHLVRLEFPEPTLWSHFEIQLNLSQQIARFSLPKLQTGSRQDILDSTEPFQLLLSPVIPLVRVLDVITDSSFQKSFVVTSVESWDDVRRATLGWSTQVRVGQPTELYRLLPRRSKTETPHRVPSAGDNRHNPNPRGNPHWRT